MPSLASLIDRAGGRRSSRIIARVTEVSGGECSAELGRMKFRAILGPGVTARPGDTVRLVESGGRYIVDGTGGRSLRTEIKEIWIDG